MDITFPLRYGKHILQIDMVNLQYKSGSIRWVSERVQSSSKCIIQ